MRPATTTSTRGGRSSARLTASHSSRGVNGLARTAPSAMAPVSSSHGCPIDKDGSAILVDHNRVRENLQQGLETRLSLVHLAGGLATPGRLNPGRDHESEAIDVDQAAGPGHPRLRPSLRSH